MSRQSKFTNGFALIYRQKMLKNAVMIGARQYIVFDGRVDGLYKFPKIKNIKYFSIPEPLTKNWPKRLKEMGYDKNKISFVSLMGIGFDMAKLAFSSLILSLSDILKEGSSLVLDFAEAPQKEGISYRFEELATILNVAGFAIYEYISPKDWAEMWSSDRENIGLDENKYHGVILAVKKG